MISNAALDDPEATGPVSSDGGLGAALKQLAERVASEKTKSDWYSSVSADSSETLAVDWYLA